MSDKEQWMIRAIDLAQRAQQQNRYCYSKFLTLEEQDQVKRAMKKEGYTSYCFDGGVESAIRRLAVFGSEKELGYEPQSPISVIHIQPLAEKFAEDLTHRDYLGAILNLGIDRSTTGDILIRGKQAWLFCLESTAEFIIENLQTVRHTRVKCSVENGAVPQIQPVLKEFSLNVSSERLDALIAAVMGESRSKAQKLLLDERIFVNGSCIKNAGTTLKEGDVLTIRGFGKMIYQGIEGKSKKGRYYVAVKRYI